MIILHPILYPPSECLSIDGPPSVDMASSLYSGVQKKPLACPVESLASALREQLTYDRDSDSLTTSPSSSSLDTCSSQKIFKAFSKSSSSPSHQEKGVEGVVREAGRGSGSSLSDTEGCNDEEPKIARSVTDGELRRRALSPLSHHGVSTDKPNIKSRISFFFFASLPKLQNKIFSHLTLLQSIHPDNFCVIWRGFQSVTIFPISWHPV